MLSEWTNTELWKLLESKDKETESTRYYVKHWLDEVQTLLAKGGTSPLDFTLHDDDHSYRVAQRMVEIIPPSTLAKLSEYEISLLLLSAYLHDIGMNPRRSIVTQIRDYLISGEADELDLSEALELRKWLDNTHPGTQPPIHIDLNPTQRINRAEFLTAYFCRHRHNDWSEKYISDNAKNLKQHPYAAWIQDLVLLCKSHHYGFSTLMTPPFDLRMVGSVGKLVNLRYLAAILRIADVLEFDPERTPAVIFTHRSPDFNSTIYWHKDHEISLSVERGTWDIFFNARTDNAWTHRAILDTADGVDAELEVCAVIDKQNGFLRGKRIDEGGHYEWPWSSRLSRLVEPLPDTFVYIDGSFRPNSARILSLLAGTQLYQTPFAAIRELLQNAFDAVREQIAIELLQDLNPLDRDLQVARARLHRVSLSVEQRGEETWIVCTDTGSGMTRRIIEKYLLVSGSQPRPELLELQRDCLAKGLRFDRSGEFGIGVLSYFMIADRMIVESRSASDLFAENENQGWHFEIDGLDTVGELRPSNRQGRGTSVQLRVRDSVNATLDSDSFRLFLSLLVAKAPCNVEINAFNFSRLVGPGWVEEADQHIEQILKEDFEGGVDRRFRSQDEVNIEAERKWSAVRAVARSKLRFFGSMEGLLPNDMGAFRLMLPYFELQAGPSLGFLHEVDGQISQLPNNNLCILSLSRLKVSWRGFAISGGNVDGLLDAICRSIPVIVELDIVQQAKISVNRESLTLENRDQLITFLHQRINSLVSAFLKFQAGSPYVALTLGFIDSAYFHSGITKQAKMPALPDDGVDYSELRTWWIAQDISLDDRRLVWRKIRFPAIERDDNPGDDLSNELLRANGLADELVSLSPRYRRLSPLPGIWPDRLIIVDAPALDLAAVYDANCHKGPPLAELFGPGSPVMFPPEWSDVAVIETPDRIFLNKDHPVLKALTADLWFEFHENRGDNPSFDVVSGLATREMAAAWLLFHFDEDAGFWQSFQRKDVLSSRRCSSW